jgi:hypothetical protein
MIGQLLKKYEISILLFIGLLCFVISLCFYGSQLPGKKIIFSEFFLPNKLKLVRDTIHFESGTRYRVTSFYESRGTNNFRPDIQLKVEEYTSIIIDEHLSTNGGSGGRDGQIYWGHNNYGLFSVPSSGDFKLSVYAANYPKDFIALKVFIAENASNFGRNSFIVVGLIMFLVLFIRKGSVKVKIK